MRPQGVDDLGALTYQHIARAMLHQLTLLFGRFDPHEAHCRAPNRFADRLGVGGIVVALKEAFISFAAISAPGAQVS